MKRLGPQNPLSWIKDTRENPARQRGVVNPVSSHRQTYRFQSDGESPVEVIVVINGDRKDRNVSIEVAEEGKRTMNIAFKTSNGQGKGSNVKST